MQNYRYDLPLLITILEDMDALDRFVRDVFHFDIMCEQNFELADTLFDPLQDLQTKLGLLEGVLSIYFDEYFYAFLIQLVVKDDIVYYEKIRDHFLETLKAMQDCLYAKATTAIPLSAAQTARITAKLKELFNKQVFVHNKVSHDFGAGLLIQCGDKMLDFELGAGLSRLKNAINAP